VGIGLPLTATVTIRACAVVMLDEGAVTVNVGVVLAAAVTVGVVFTGVVTVTEFDPVAL
jgi:hypothetical protein